METRRSWRRGNKGDFLWNVVVPISRGYATVPSLPRGSPRRFLISARRSCTGNDGGVNRILLGDIRKGTSGVRYRYRVVVGKRYGSVLDWRKGARENFGEWFARRD